VLLTGESGRLRPCELELRGEHWMDYQNEAYWRYL